MRKLLVLRISIADPSGILDSFLHVDYQLVDNECSALFGFFRFGKLAISTISFQLVALVINGILNRGPKCSIKTPHHVTVLVVVLAGWWMGLSSWNTIALSGWTLRVTCLPFCIFPLSFPEGKVSCHLRLHNIRHNFQNFHCQSSVFRQRSVWILLWSIQTVC